MDIEKSVDESWKDAVSKDKDSHGDGCGCGHDHGDDHGDDQDGMKVDFFNYIASMGYQAMIFLGEVPNPITQRTEQNLRQAKFLIDTIALVREKTVNNLSAPEDQFINGTLYELQMKYVELSNKPKIV
ncbi:MAG: DUF1844 domain-containing protein [Candidatus Omnitrophica bacterium]|nr:DUF1844 domain-containing protein [Candidatus Omnitrophota bacterium]